VDRSERRGRPSGSAIHREILATVETNSFVGVRDRAEFTADPRSIHVETDFSFGDGMTARVAAAGVHWKADPLYATQSTTRGRPVPPRTHPGSPDQVIEPRGRSIVPHLRPPRLDRAGRQGIALRQMYALAPWSQENPI
jgi:hypothetical protein